MLGQGESATGDTAARGAARTEPSVATLRALRIGIALLVAKRIAYHLTYLVSDPFALATFSDGQIYENAARDILAHAPLGAEPFYLQGLYAYVLALPMAIADQAVMGLLLQLVLAAGALWLFHRTVTREFGALAGGLSTLVLLAYPELAFYENKYLSVSVGVSCNVFALWAACRAFRDQRPAAFGLAGFATALAALGRPNMLLALPFTWLGSWMAVRGRTPGSAAARVLLAFVLGGVLALAPMALRNQLVVGSPDVFPSHTGAIPFYIGNNPHSNGRWNTAGGLITGQVALERMQLAERLGLHETDPQKLDRQVGRALFDRALQFIREQPVSWLWLEAKKVWYTIGNHRFVRDYDVRGENELIGAVHQFGLPFGALLALGSIGLFVVLRRASSNPPDGAQRLAVVVAVSGQLVAVVAANVLVFASAQNRVPLCIPLAFVAGPALLAIWGRLRDGRAQTWQVSWVVLAIGVLLFVQAFWPRLPDTNQPSSVHYYNLAAVEEVIGRFDAAAGHYARAARRNPREPMFQLSEARALRRVGRSAEARAALDRLERMHDVPAIVRSAARQERQLLDGPVPGSR